MAAEAGPPFDDPSADLILRTSDGVDFRVQRAIIATASPVFKDMFSMPPALDTPDELRDGLPVCSTITESSAILRALLRFSYPQEDPAPLALDDVIPALVAAIKYQMEGTRAMAALKVQLAGHAAVDTLRVYAAAVIHSFEDEARVAACAALHYDALSLARQKCAELACIPATALQRLLQFMDECSIICSEMCQEHHSLGKCFPWMDSQDIQRYMNDHGWVPAGQWSIWALQNCTCDTAVVVTFGSPHWVWRAPKWWWDFVQEAGVALYRRPVGQTVSNRELLRKTHRTDPAAPTCEHCRIGVDSVQLMQGFVEFVAKEVDRRTLELAQQTKFC